MSRCWRRHFSRVHIMTAVADRFAPIRIVDLFVPFVGYVPAVLARARCGRARSAARARDHEPAARTHRLSRVASRALGGIRLLADRAAARARHRQRHAGSMGAARVTSGVSPPCSPRCSCASGGPALRRRDGGCSPRSGAPRSRSAWSRGCWPSRCGPAGRARPARRARSSPRPPAARAGRGDAPQIPVPFTSALRGSIRQTSPSRASTRDDRRALSAIPGGRLRVVIDGTPLADGGVSMDRGTVHSGTRRRPTSTTETS